MYTLHLNSDAGLGFRVRDRVPGAHLGTVFVHSPGAHSEKHSPMCLYIENALGQWHLRMSENFVPGAVWLWLCDVVYNHFFPHNPTLPK